ncbi:glycoside hydrolase family 3 N-terminal domain-containing protein [Halorarius litoreus]|uniref:glycoside hydrolase family 3 N-terminal domain-containing protein n=1 Tax=Halorarius litoreus TaxID=2962676 RepID=UPI0020CC676C|nr:glycoside hydrolase family 3 N-terminal domain-containing protein [Halorarius litoreus]
MTVYRESESIEQHVEALLQRMTLHEKAGQCCGTYVGKVGAVRQSLEDVLEEVEAYQLGFATPFGIASTPHTDPREVAEVANRLQRRAIEESRLGIPLIIPVDATHGHAYIASATVFPHNLGLGATWDPELARRIGRVTAREVRATGAHQNYGPTCDVVRDPRWGRTFETFGESPLLVGEMVAAKIRGSREAEPGVLTTAKHFPAYGAPERGEDAAPVDVSPRTLRRGFLPPFERAIEAGADVVMPCYNAVNGVPAHGSEQYLSGLLREDLGFDGAIASDWGGVDQLHEDHRVTDSREASIRLAFGAGLDVASIGGVRHARAIHDAVETGAISRERLDESVRRILTAKFRLGLFDDPYVDPDRAAEFLGHRTHRELAYEAARKSVTLLENDGLLPLSGDEDVLVTGPNADAPLAQVGGWSVEDPDGVAGATIYEALQDGPGTGSVSYEPGLTPTGDDAPIDAAVDAARDADVAVVVLGEGWYIHEFASNPPKPNANAFPSRIDLSLPEAQQRLLEGIHETGTPTVLTLVSGRPLAVSWAAQNLPALIWSYYPGTEGGRALADVLFGDQEPGGRLPISIPRSTGHLPVVHDHLPHPHPAGTNQHVAAYDPLFPFGHGLSYTEFAYRDLRVSPEEIPIDGTVEATVTVENVGERVGEEVVQFYLHARSGPLVRPVRELCGFERVRLDPGQERSVSVRLGTDALGIVLEDGRRVVSPGRYEIGCADLLVPFEAAAH